MLILLLVAALFVAEAAAIFLAVSYRRSMRAAHRRLDLYKRGEQQRAVILAVAVLDRAAREATTKQMRVLLSKCAREVRRMVARDGDNAETPQPSRPDPSLTERIDRRLTDRYLRRYTEAQRTADDQEGAL